MGFSICVCDIVKKNTSYQATDREGSSRARVMIREIINRLLEDLDAHVIEAAVCFLLMRTIGSRSWPMLR
jgi:hypothetical protein